MPPPRRILPDYQNVLNIFSTKEIFEPIFRTPIINPLVFKHFHDGGTGDDVLEPGNESSGGGNNTGGTPPGGWSNTSPDTSNIRVGVVSKGGGGGGPGNMDDIRSENRKKNDLVTYIYKYLQGGLDALTIALFTRQIANGKNLLGIVEFQSELKDYVSTIETQLFLLNSSQLQSILDKIFIIDSSIGLAGALLGQSGSQWAFTNALTFFGLEALAGISGATLAASWEFLVIILTLIALCIFLNEILGPLIDLLIDWAGERLKEFFKWTDEQINNLQKAINSFENKIRDLYGHP